METKLRSLTKKIENKSVKFAKNRELEIISSKILKKHKKMYNHEFEDRLKNKLQVMNNDKSENPIIVMKKLDKNNSSLINLEEIKFYTLILENTKTEANLFKESVKTLTKKENKKYDTSLNDFFYYFSQIFKRNDIEKMIEKTVKKYIEEQREIEKLLDDGMRFLDKKMNQHIDVLKRLRDK
jgi:hypothetical protein